MKIKVFRKFSQNLRDYDNKRRVVVTGLGMVSSLGINTQESWNNITHYKSGIIDLSNEYYAKDLPNNVRIGAPIPKHFNSKKYKTLVIIK
jgi:3-oxoacyl-[acyl-carrier-protein] synthase II